MASRSIVNTWERGGVWAVIRWFRRVNWPLVFGSLLALLILVVALKGPDMAPRDPNESTLIMQYEDEWYRSPMRAFVVPDFPLGTDQLGRDLLSQILWAVRPTMILVVIISTVRMTLGILIGMLAGWSTGQLGRALDTLITGALAMPVLMVALATIAAIGVESGLWAFIVGLSLTGWSETARHVREQTRHIRGQQYIEAAQSLGSSDFQILSRHVLRQIMPMVWMLFAFEVGAVLLVTAGLGFLGYYIGGEVFYFTSDTAVERIASVPELGQMLATSWISLIEPWGLIATGLMVLVMVLGFNLLGEGLKQRLNPEEVNRNTLFARLMTQLNWWMEERVFYPFSQSKIVRPVLIGAVLLTFGGMTVWKVGGELFNFAPRFDDLLEVPGGHLWGSERHDPYGTAWTPTIGPQNPEILWTFNDPDGFAGGGPVIAADGTIYIASGSGNLLALNPEGELIREIEIPEGIPAGDTPALGLNGEIYLVDGDAGLTAFSPEGETLWHYDLHLTTAIASAPIVGPDGVIYYQVEGAIQAVNPDGTMAWFGRTGNNLRNNGPPRLSPDGQYIFVDNIALSTLDGSTVDFGLVQNAVVGTSNQFAREFYQNDLAGRSYLLSRNVTQEWLTGENGIALGIRNEWDPNLAVFGDSQNEGIAPDQMVWLLYTFFVNTDSTIHWIDNGGHVLGSLQLRHRPTNVLGLDGDSSMYICGRNRDLDNGMECMGLAPGTNSPDEAKWIIAPDEGHAHFVIGGAIGDGVIYVATWVFEPGMQGDFIQSTLYAIGDQ